MVGSASGRERSLARMRRLQVRAAAGGADAEEIGPLRDREREAATYQVDHRAIFFSPQGGEHDLTA